MGKAAERQIIIAKALTKTAEKHRFSTLSPRSRAPCVGASLAKRAQESHRNTTNNNRAAEQIFKDLRFPFFGSQVFLGGRFTCKNTVLLKESSPKRAPKKAPKKDPKRPHQDRPKKAPRRPQDRPKKTANTSTETAKKATHMNKQQKQ